MSDLINRQDAIDALIGLDISDGVGISCIASGVQYSAIRAIEDLPSAEPEIVRCKDCKFYNPMNRETKTGICNLTMHQNFGDNWFCAGAERRTNDSNK